MFMQGINRKAMMCQFKSRAYDVTGMGYKKYFGYQIDMYILYVIKRVGELLKTSPFEWK